MNLYLAAGLMVITTQLLKTDVWNLVWWQATKLDTTFVQNTVYELTIINMAIVRIYAVIHPTILM
jgi:hypothetical protein